MATSSPPPKGRRGRPENPAEPYSAGFSVAGEAGYAANAKEQIGRDPSVPLGLTWCVERRCVGNCPSIAATTQRRAVKPVDLYLLVEIGLVVPKARNSSL